MYDAIVVGARVAGSSTAMLLSRKGLNVLVVDRASFPSDTMSTHQVQLPGIARLHRWGVLDRVVASNAPATRRVRFETPAATLEGTYPCHEGMDAMFSPRRTVLDWILVDAAREAGAEVRERFIVDELVVEDGRVVGIRGATKDGGPAITERARLVIGADGKHSMVAKAVGAERYREKPALTVGSYTYFEGVPMSGGEIYSVPRRAAGAWPTNDGLVMTFVAWPIDEFEAFRKDVEANLLATLDHAGDLGERVRVGRRVERVRSTPDVPNFLRRPYGPGWALVGDAGAVMDPITGQGISDAFRDAELLAGATQATLVDGEPFDEAMAEYHRQRDEAMVPMYDFTTDLASFRPSRPEEETLFRALEGKPEEISRFLGVIAGAVPLGEYMHPKNLMRLIGMRGMAKAMLSRMRAGKSKPAA
jgi:flavin-dependent dehydrogenase